RRDRIVFGLFGREIQLNHALVTARAYLTTDGQRAVRRRVVPAMQNQRLHVEQIGNAVGDEINDLQIVTELQLDVGENRRLDALRKAGDGSVCVAFEQDIFRFAATRAGHTVEQITVDAVADAEAEDARRLRVFLDGVDDLHVIADVTVGHKAADAD